MKKNITRRDFLKLASLLPLSITPPQITNSLSSQQNIIIIVFDALSASNISLYGYQRDTMPNLSRLAEKAIVYHNHYAGGNFTTPGTASLLTGTLPWTHRAFRPGSTVEESFTKKNIFSAFDDYYQITYSHNPWVYKFLYQFQNNIDELLPLNKFLLFDDDIIPNIFENDNDLATVSWVRTIKRKKEGFSYSLFLSYLYEQYQKFGEYKIRNIQTQYPRGVPAIHYSNYFLLEDAIDLISNILDKIQQPFLGYFHFWPPHEPYRTHKKFYGRFENDSFLSIEKPFSPFFQSRNQKDPFRIPKLRIAYDESILYADNEFGRLYDNLEKSGLIDNTWIILTSDHGELFERGIEAHFTPVLYQPLIRIPLVIFEPRRTNRTDIFTPTSAIDVLPTLLNVTGHNQVPFSEGVILPPFTPTKDIKDRNLYAIEAKHNDQFSPFTVATTTIIRGNYKLMYFFGYEIWGENSKHIELYDIENDPEELNDLYQSKIALSRDLLKEMEEKLVQVNKPYE